MRFLTTTLLAMSITAVVSAQNASPPEFEVASVKPAAPDRPIGEVLRRPPPGQWWKFGITLQNSIQNAQPEFRLPGLIVGGPAWMREARFDLQARMSPTATPAQVQAMFRRLLDVRFGLRTHVEQRMLDVFVMTLARPGIVGPGMEVASPACVDWTNKGGPVPDECQGRRGETGGFAISAATTTDLITFVSLGAMLGRPNAIDRPIIDRTGLDGHFKMVGPNPLAADPSWFTLMQEQLGLKFTRAREAVDVLVIDSASMPEPD